MTLHWVLLLTLVTTIVAGERSTYDENGNDLLRLLDNRVGHFGTWRSPSDDNDEEIENAGNIIKNGESINNNAHFICDKFLVLRYKN